MSTTVKVIIGAAIALVAGIVICGIAFAIGGKTNMGIGSTEYVTEVFEIEDEFTNISVTALTSDITIDRSDDGKCRVEFFQPDYMELEAGVNNGTLEIEVNEDDPARLVFNIMSKTPTIKVYLPEEVYEDLSIDVTTGDIILGGISYGGSVDIKVTTGDIGIGNNVSDDLTYGDLNIEVNTGDIVIDNVGCQDLIYNVVTGDIQLRDVLAADNINITGTTGDLTFDGCDARRITVNLVTGDINGTLLTDKDFDAHTVTGDIDVPSSSEGGRCELTTTTGDIVIDIES